jgi:hypothetical protein
MRAARLRLALLAVLLAGASVWLLATGAPSSGQLQRAVRGTGLLAPLAFVAIYVGWTVLLLPGAVPTVSRVLPPRRRQQASASACPPSSVDVDPLRPLEAPGRDERDAAARSGIDCRTH